ncbi:MAG: biotin carboxyl carrier domain-containing protein [Solirubrobacterales bacterium]|nr:biotin carboxyl carrier domain-containing protein [Solirubrobacterales bacterium]MBV9801343.1 biotin carboxyl carrier domain-containing protein [Solirubrobacterales bacterium]
MSDKTIKAPLPGTFYRKPDPAADAFVTEGDSVQAGDVVGLVEIMKNFHEVKADDSGVVERFLVEDEDSVEAGQDLAVLGE